MPTDPHENLKAAWREIDAARNEHTQRVIGFGTAGNEVRLHLDTEGCLHLLIPLTADQTVPEGHSTRVLILKETRKTPGGGDSIRFMDLGCMRGYLNDVFKKMVEEILRKENAGTPFIQAVPEVITEFKEMLQKAPPPIGKEATLGLIGELYTLRELIRDKPESLQNWKGPLGEHQDFIAPRVALEVKSSAQKKRIARIASFQQLDKPTGRELYLVLHQFEENIETGLNIPELYDEIISLGANHDQFESKMGAVGYDHFNRESYESHRFKHIESFYYLVDEAFPKIIPSSFKTSPSPLISSHGYSVNLQGENPPVIPFEQTGSITGKLKEV
jgi:hypothetical protein